MILYAVIATVLALLLYTVAVWGVRKTKVLRPWHLVCFLAGLVFDAIGSTLMATMAHNFGFNLHGVIGIIAIAAMVINAAWAALALFGKNAAVQAGFIRASLIIWIIWIISFLSGAALGMQA